MRQAWLRLMMGALVSLWVVPGCDPASGEKAARDEDDGDEKKKKKSSDDDDDDDDDDRKSKKSKKKKSVANGDEDASDDDDDDEKKAVTTPEQQSYPLDAVKTIADNCQSPSVILATAPESLGLDYEWAFASQAMLANQQFKVVRNAPTGPAQVAFDVHQADDRFQKALVLVAHCNDGSTCNRLAAMYKAIVKTSSPQLACGKMAMELGPGTKKRSFVDIGGSGEASLPKKSDPIGLCARIGACMIATDPGLAGNPALDCQKRPSDFKTACATKYPCSEVLACLER